MLTISLLLVFAIIKPFITMNPKSGKFTLNIDNKNGLKINEFECSISKHRMYNNDFWLQYQNIVCTTLYYKNEEMC